MRPFSLATFLLCASIFFALFAQSTRAEDAAKLEALGADALKLSQSDADAIVSAACFYGNASLAYEQAGNDEKATEMNSYLYWCKKKMTLQQMDAFLKGKEQSAAVIAKRMEELEKTSAADPQDYVRRAEAFAAAHPDEHLLIAVRFYEIADRFKGTDASLNATDRSLKEMQKIAVRSSAAKPPVSPAKNDSASSADSEKQLKRKNDLKTLGEMALAIKTPDEARQLLKAALALCDDAIAADDYAIAEKAAASAQPLADALRDAAVVKQVHEKSAQIVNLKIEFSQVQKHLQTLKTTPADPKANLAVGKYLCFVKDDWQKGLPLLAIGDDAVLKKLADVDTGGGQDAANWVALGDGWWEQGQKLSGMVRRNVLHRSVGFYLKTSQTTAGLPKMKIDKHIAEFFKNNIDDLFTFNPSAESTQNSDQAGEAGGSTIQSPEFGFVVGLKIHMGNFDGRPNIRSVQPIFQTRKGQVIGNRIGGVDGVKEYNAKPGYAVNGVMLAKGTHRFAGIKIIYQRINGLSLDPTDSYESEWIGDHKNTDTTTTQQSPGKMVIGITGIGGADMDGLGLLFLKTYRIDFK